MKQILSVARKELDSYFGSPMATIFLGAFLAVTLFTFFWVETFFARGIADLRPLFQWLPLLLIFLISALTMRQWSEEQRSGTLEMLLTLPIGTVKLVLGKFLAVMALAALALALTLPLPITVAQLGNLDWGPVFSGYLAALLLAGAYASIGLFVSSRTDNQIVALIATAVIGGLFYLVGTRGVTNFVGTDVATLLRSLGTGSRFQSIERGVIDLRDLLYYLSLTGVFLALNVLSLKSLRWSEGESARFLRQRETLLVTLLSLNLVVANLWLYPLHSWRIDTTESRIYSLSTTTQNLLSTLQEPLLIRGYVSEQTHPLLSPLVPRIRDLLEEYEIAGQGRVTAEVVDPTTDPELEAEANQTYGIQPTPFRVTDRYQASVVNSYFNILIRYGDQDVILGVDDLIEVNQGADGSVDVQLRNLEYDLTRSIKRTVYGFQSIDAMLAAQEAPVNLTLFVTEQSLPPELADAPATIQAVAEEIAAESDGNFIFERVDPDASDSQIDRQALQEQYGMQPFPVSLFSSQTYYLHMVLAMDETSQVLYPPSGEISNASVRQAIEAALKRNSPGFLRTVGVWTPQPAPSNSPFGPQQSPASYQMLQQQLSEQYNVQPVTLTDGRVPENVDVLLVVAAQDMSDRQQFAIDQYLMQGGSVVLAAGNYTVAPDQMTGMLGLQPVESGLQDLLQHYGVNVQDSLVLDTQNQPFPVTVQRQVEGFQVQEIQGIPYPFFVDVRPGAMDRDNPIASNLPAVTLSWASPVVLDEEVLDEEGNAAREASVILRSTEQSWLRTDTNIQPDMQTYPQYGFPVGDEQQSYPLAVSLHGGFTSYYAEHPSPWEQEESEPSPEGTGEAEPTPEPPPAVIEQSPESARLFVVGSSEFVNDMILNLSANLSPEQYLNNLLLVQNAVDWAVEDLDLLAIRARGDNVRILEPMTEEQQSLWEFANYVVALLALLGVAFVWRVRRSSEEPLFVVEETQRTDLSVEPGD